VNAPGIPPTDSDDDIQLMTRVAEGSMEAFGLLVRRHQQPLLNFFCRMGARMDAEDMVQETFLRLFNYRRRYRPSAKFTTFLYTVARHVWLDALRKAKRKEELTEKVRVETEWTSDSGMRRLEMRMDVQSLLERLPEKLRSVVVLVVYRGFRYEEAATVLDVPLGTVKSRVFLALQRLREMFDANRENDK
jgi:RNA polymerase sigma-70 factor (ECF subfamily)